MKRSANSEDKIQKKRKDEVEQMKEEEGSDGEGIPEDPFEDEYEEEEMIETPNVEGEEGEEATQTMEEEEDEEKKDTEPKKIWRPGVDQLQEGEVLEFDNTAYEMLHTINLEWSSLSVDVIPDKLGIDRSRYPLTAYYAVGTQADNSQNNKLTVMKLSSIYKTKYDNTSDAESEDEEHLDEDPILESRHVKHPGCINRIRVMPQEPHIIATWSEDSHVYLWDMSQHIASLDTPPTSKLVSKGPIKQLQYSAEGYALDWSHLVKGRLAVGSSNKQIYVVEPHQATWIQEEMPYSGHQNSVEDINWSPTEATVFASASADKTVKIWDTRMKKGPAVSWQVAECDVNAISWNKKVAYLLASGADDGSFKVWDLRTLKQGGKNCESVGHFKWHNDQITSIQWDPNDESVIAVSGADDQVSIWDLSMESDPESNVKFENDVEVPPQLLFLHQGQKDIREVRWHPQIPGMLASTAEDSFNIWQPSIETGEEQPNTTTTE